MKNTYYGYIRVSTVKQGDGVSPAEQKDAIERYALNNKLQISEWFEEQKTAGKAGRPAFSTMMKKLKKGEAKGVIIHKIDRGARNLRDWLELTEDPNIDVQFAHENVDLMTRSGRLTANMLAVVATDMIMNQKQETRKGLQGRLKQGIYPFNALIGYLNTGAGNPKAIDPFKGPLIKRAFELYATGKYTLKTMAALLNKWGVKNSQGGKLYPSNVSLILNNPFYMGIMLVKGEQFRGIHEPLITPALFKKVQLVLTGKTNQKKRSYEFLFRKLIRCSLCDYAMVGEVQKSHIYYRCHTKECPTKGLKQNYVENLLVKGLTTAQLQEKELVDLDAILVEMQRDWKQKQKEIHQSIKLHVVQLESKLERLTDALLDGAIDRETYEKRKGVFLVELKECEAKEKEISTGKQLLFKKVEKFLERIKSLKKSYDLPNPAFKRKMVQLVTSNLSTEGKNLRIAMKSPFQELANRSFLEFGAPERNTYRKVYPIFVYSDINTSPIISERLSKSQLTEFVNYLLSNPQFLPDIEEDFEEEVF